MSKEFEIILGSGIHKGKKLVGLREIELEVYCWDHWDITKDFFDKWLAHSVVPIKQQDFKILGKLSEITEDKAKELGFNGCTADETDSIAPGALLQTAKQELVGLMCELCEQKINRMEDLENILLILISPS